MAIRVLGCMTRGGHSGGGPWLDRRRSGSGSCDQNGPELSRVDRQLSDRAQAAGHAARASCRQVRGVFLPLSRAEIERRADAFASGRVQVPAGPLLVQAAYLLTTQMSQEDIQRVVGSDREINDISSSMFIAVFGDFADALSRSKAGRNLDRLTLSFAFIFYLLHDRAVSEGLL